MLSSPEARPDCSEGTDAMMPALFGEVNRPRPPPTTASKATNPAVAGRSRPNPVSPHATRAMPITAGKRTPYRSAIRPDSGATSPRATGMTISSRPVRTVP
jgi:hypothetical protein